MEADSVVSIQALTGLGMMAAGIDRYCFEAVGSQEKICLQ